VVVFVHSSGSVLGEVFLHYQVIAKISRRNPQGRSLIRFGSRKAEIVNLHFGLNANYNFYNKGTSDWVVIKNKIGVLN
jgi:hypothetical protein